MFFTNNFVDIDVLDTLSMGRSSTLVAWQSNKEKIFENL